MTEVLNIIKTRSKLTLNSAKPIFGRKKLLLFFFIATLFFYAEERSLETLFLENYIELFHRTMKKNKI